MIPTPSMRVSRTLSKPVERLEAMSPLACGEEATNRCAGHYGVLGVLLLPDVNHGAFEGREEALPKGVVASNTRLIKVHNLGATEETCLDGRVVDAHEEVEGQVVHGSYGKSATYVVVIEDSMWASFPRSL